MVVGEVLTVEQHPDADRLRVTTNIGSGEPCRLSVVRQMSVGMKALLQRSVQYCQVISKIKRQAAWC